MRGDRTIETPQGGLTSKIRTRRSGAPGTVPLLDLSRCCSGAGSERRSTHDQRAPLSLTVVTEAAAVEITGLVKRYGDKLAVEVLSLLWTRNPHIQWVDTVA
jgi:hypothetical protein